MSHAAKAPARGLGLTIGRKLLAVLLTVSIMAFAAVVGISVMDRVEDTRRAEQGAVTALSLILAEQTAGGLRWNKADVVAASFAPILALEGNTLASLVAFDGEGKPLVREDAKGLASYDLSGQVGKHGAQLTQSNPYIVEIAPQHILITVAAFSGKARERVGTLALAWSTERIAAQNAASVRSGIGVSAAGLLAIAVLMLLAVNRLVSRPLAQLGQAMTRLADRDWSTEVPATGRRDEVGAMARAVQVFKESGIENERLQRLAEETRAREEEMLREQEAREREAAEAKRRAAEAARLAEERRRAETLEQERQAEETRRAEQERMRAEAEARRRDDMIRLADQFEAAIGAVVGGVAEAAEEMRRLAEQMAGAVDRTNDRAGAVASASEQASANVQTVAAAAEELAASVSEISRQVQTSTGIAAEAVAQAGDTNREVEGLAEAAKRIGEIVNMIQDIAGKTNLLALNATIEAARAGEAGKGFAVVASEVKNLATQTAKATQDISTQIAAIQGRVGGAVGAIRAIGATIGQVSEIATSIASAVEEQGAATQEIARNVQEASSGTQQVSSNIAGVSEVASETREAASHVLAAAGELSRQAEALRGEVGRFIDRVRAA